MNKDIWDDLGRAVTGAADAVSRKAGEIVEITRLKNQIYSLEREIRRDYEALGKIVYERYTCLLYTSLFRLHGDNLYLHLFIPPVFQIFHIA